MRDWTVVYLAKGERKTIVVQAEDAEEACYQVWNMPGVDTVTWVEAGDLSDNPGLFVYY